MAIFIGCAVCALICTASCITIYFFTNQVVDSNDEEIEFITKAIEMLEHDINVNEQLIADIKANKIKVQE